MLLKGRCVENLESRRDGEDVDGICILGDGQLLSFECARRLSKWERFMFALLQVWYHDELRLNWTHETFRVVRSLFCMSGGEHHKILERCRDGQCYRNC